MTTIHREYGDFILNDRASLNDVENTESFFFKPFGHARRETHEMYRGFLINRLTTDFDGKPCRVMSIYMFGHWIEEDIAKDHLSSPVETFYDVPVSKARKYVDELLKE